MTKNLTPAHLIDAARAWARGSYALEAAVELLVQHDVWLHRPEFRRYAVDYITATYTRIPYAVIDWQAAHAALSRGRMPCSGSEAAVLRIALSIADGVPVELGPAITCLDATNLARVLAAINHAQGNRAAWLATRGDATS
ncbi:hypothetical protein AB0K05_29045 [Nonomuraea sp. NPDC049486]|uniref:hypothetical protein n=1 Tax=Nonomuraea sp. NPDC049486 TaxID=3155773 RepID=UPI00344557FE